MTESSGGCGCSGAPPRMGPELRLDELTLAQTDALATDTLIRRYSVGVEWFDPRIFHLSDEQLDRAFLPDAGCGRWSVRALAAHLVDCEMLLLSRMRVTIAEERPVLALFDEEAFLASDLYGPGARAGSRVVAPVAGSVAVIHTLRRWALDWLGDLSEAHWARTAMHPQRGEVAARFWLAYATWHLEHHVAIANRKIERILGPLRVEGDGGRRASCACRATEGADCAE